MRICAIRGENLASLERFEVDLRGPVLGRAGLFAITGPTGAGKSTLLDAMCLALFDKTPRLSERGGPEIGPRGAQDNLSAQDVRALLRRGAGAGFAEVDFIGVDGHPYRARWSVWRAHNKPTNRFQKQALSLERLDPALELTGATKTDTLALIEAQVGLSFDQFRRSVLLAQGEFDAFLRAKSKDRGALLERMTGAGLYRRLSLAAHQRSAREQAEVAALREKAETVQRLSAVSRAAHEAVLAAGAPWVEAAEARCAALADARRWYAETARRAAAADAARAELTATDAAYAAAGPRRDLLAQVEAAGPLRGDLERHDHAVQREAEAQRQRAEAERARDAASAAAATAAAALASAQAAADGARAAAEAAAPALATARKLDAKLESLAPALAQAEARAASAEAEADAARAGVARVEREILASTEAAREARAWLVEAAAWAPVAAQWPRWADALARLQRARAATPEGAADRAAAEAALAEADRALAAAEATPIPPAHDVDGLVARQGQLSRLVDLASDVRASLGAVAQAEARLEAARQARAAARRRVTAQTRKRDQARLQLAEAEAAARQLDAMAQLVALRHVLEDGVPCPLCGSPDHPGVQADAVRSAQAERVGALRDQERAADTARSKAEGEAELHARAVEAAREDSAARQTEVGRTRTDWEVTRMALAAVDLPTDPSAPGALAAAQALRAENHDAREAAEAANRARVAAVARLEALRESRARAAAAAQQARAAAEARARCAEIEAELAPVFAAIEWPAQDLPGFVDRAAAQVERWHEAEARQAECERQVAEASPRLAALRERSRQAERAARQAADALNDRLAERDGLRAARADVLGGRAVAEVEGELSAQATPAEADVRTSQALAAAAREARAAANARFDAADAQATARATQLEEARARLAEALAAAALDEASARRLLAHDAAWIGAERAALGALSSARERAHAVAEERAEDLAAFLAEAAPTVAEAALADTMAEAGAALQAFRQAVDFARRAIEADDAAARAQRVNQRRLERREVDARVWADLNALIGSSDGSRFREFAQSLTLEAVVAQANAHLAELAPRYRLMRIPSEDLEVQIVDQDLGDDIRSVNSLSGGESFQVSLALALGLASLSAQDTQVESLFIDEGLGTLDENTLGQVLGTLDALQASGRQVGLISHVAGLAGQLDAEVRVERVAAGLSRVRVRGLRD